MKFTFKKVSRDGRYSSFNKKWTDIKLNKKICGYLTKEANKKWVVRFMIVKDENNTDDNLNCDWKWIRFAIRFETEEGARTWLNIKADYICERYNLRMEE